MHDLTDTQHAQLQRYASVRVHRCPRCTCYRTVNAVGRWRGWLVLTCSACVVKFLGR